MQEQLPWLVGPVFEFCGIAETLLSLGYPPHAYKLKLSKNLDWAEEELRWVASTLDEASKSNDSLLDVAAGSG